MPTSRRPHRVLVCTNHRLGATADSCGRRGGDRLLRALHDANHAGLLPDHTSIEAGPCLGHCAKGPNVRIVGGAILHGVEFDDDSNLARVVAALTDADGRKVIDQDE